MKPKSKVQYINPKGCGPAQGLYSHVGTLPAGATTYMIAGQLAVGKNGEVVGKHDFDAQFHQVFSNLKDVLDGLGITPNHVAKFTTYLVHSQDIEHFMRCRAKLFPKYFGSKTYPPNTLLMVDRLVKEDFLIEVEAVASSV
jgi:enamine deaminase RidA (YjgF/YER057c/UK114 family)